MEDGWRNVSNPIKGNRPINIVESGLDQSWWNMVLTCKIHRGLITAGGTV